MNKMRYNMPNMAERQPRQRPPQITHTPLEGVEVAIRATLARKLHGGVDADTYLDTIRELQDPMRNSTSLTRVLMRLSGK